KALTAWVQRGCRLRVDTPREKARWEEVETQGSEGITKTFGLECENDYTRVIRYRSLRNENRSMSAIPRKQRLAVKASSVAMGHLQTLAPQQGPSRECKAC